MDNLKLLIITAVLSLGAATLHSCPAAIGRLENDTPPLFTKEYDDIFWPNNNQDSQEEGKNKSQPQQEKSQS